MFDNSSNNQPGSQFQQSPTSLPLPPAQPPYPLTPAPVYATPTVPTPQFAAPMPAVPLADPPSGDDALMAIKQHALANLTPLVGQIDQSPEEKFKTTMMLIQASDNASLIKEAYAAANQITDDKARAQALIDVINEINYFTQKQDQK